MAAGGYNLGSGGLIRVSDGESEGEEGSSERELDGGAEIGLEFGFVDGERRIV